MTACAACIGQELERIVAVAKRCDAWLLADEVYRGAEHTGEVHSQLSCIKLVLRDLVPTEVLDLQLDHTVQVDMHLLVSASAAALTSCSEPAPLVGTIKVHVQAQCTLSWRSRAQCVPSSQVPPSLWARRGGYGKVVCTGGLSKSFGLSGLRCGWLVASPELLQVVYPVLPKHRNHPRTLCLCWFSSVEQRGIWPLS